MANRRPSVYIGLGGTGIKAIAKTKKLYEEEFGKGNIPPEVAFLAIDFDNKAPSDNSLATDVSGDYLQLVTAVNPAEHYRVQRDMNQFTWMFPGNSAFIDKNIMNGAKQVRTTGRLYTEIVLNQIKARIQLCFNKVQSIAKARGYNQPVDIHLAMSVAGGSGSGSFLTIAMLIDQMFQGSTKPNMYGYAVLHGVFRAMDPMGTKTPRVITNAYAAILDLDYMMHASDENPIEVSLGPVKHVMRDPLFKEFYVIDNVTENGKVVDDCQNLCEVVGTCLYVSGNELGNTKDSAASNIGWRDGGNYNIQTKKGWVYGLGACQVVYKGALLAETYSYKAGRELIRKMVQEGADIPQKALNWTETAGIREDGEQYNMLIDSILAPAKIGSIPMPLLDVHNSDAANQGLVNKVLEEYIADMPSSEEMKLRTVKLCDELSAQIDGYLAQENGVGDALAFLASLKKRCLGYKQEMNLEEREFTRKADEKKQVLDSKGFKEYEENKYGRFTIHRDERNQELLEDVVGRPVLEIRKLRHEAKRREEAYNVFGSLISAIEKLEDKISQIRDRLNSISAAYETQLEAKQKETQSALVFEYDLSYKDRVNMTVNSGEILVPDFIKTLGVSLCDVNVEDLDEKIKAYTSGLSKAVEYKNKLIMDVVESLSEAEYEALKEEITEKSSLLLQLDGRGQTIDGMPARDKMVSSYMIAHYGDDTSLSRFERDGYFLQNVVSKEWAKSVSEVMKQKIIFYRVDGAIIPYCIGAFDDFTVKTQYEDLVVAAMSSGSTKFNPHFDAEIFAEMKKNDFKLKPEMKNEAMFYWVCGQIFGWTKILEEEREMKKDEKGNILSEDKESKGTLVEHSKYIACIKSKYYYWDEEAVAGKNDKWVTLDNTTRRDTAFNYFKTVILPQKKETFNALIKSMFQAQGQQYWKNFIEQLTADGLADYINKRICTNKNSVTYFSSESGEIKLIQQEFDFLTKQLYNSLLSLK